MTLNYSSEMWSSFARALGNHLWQSTLFAVAAGLLTLALRKNHAQARYWVWLAASVKFLIPFSLLIGLGSQLAWTHDSVRANAGVYFAMEELSRPFALATPSVMQPATAQTSYAGLIHLLPALLGVVWLCGFLAVLLVWYARWRRVSAAIGKSVELREGREVETLRRLESSGGIRKPIPLLLSADSLEPGIFGIARPVLVWPDGISERLEDAHLQAILAHEVWHVRRRDNLAAAIHMMVEAIFCFHPLVWWLGARLVEERERACDQEVLKAGAERQVYAESILKICEFCVGSPLACVSGVTGADLKKRIARIMTESFARKLDFGKKLLLSAAGLLAVALPLAFGVLHATESRAASQGQNAAAAAPGFESSSIKPSDLNSPTANFMFGTDSFTGTKITLQMLIRNAYGVEDAQISGGPSWLNSDKYDIDAKMGQSTVQKLQSLSDGERFAEWKRMVQALLEERFKLAVHRETKEVAGYALAIASGGAKLHEARPGDTYATGIKAPDGQLAGAGTMHQGVGELTVQGLPMRLVVRLLSEQLGQGVVDTTGLTGNYDFTLKWTPDESQPAMFRGIADGQAGASSASAPKSGPSLFAAIQEQLGLKLEPQKVPLGVLVIDHAEKPDESQSQTRLPLIQSASAQGTGAPRPNWQVEAGGRQTFEVASVKQNKSGSDAPSSMNVPIGPGDVYPPNGGRFSGANVPLISYIYFAYKLTGSQFQLLVPHLPKWVLTDRFDIEARAGGNPTKDQMRLMVQSLLTERFNLAIHYETQQLPAFALVLANPEKTGLHLQPHRDESSCPTAPVQTNLASTSSSPATITGGFPAVCGGIVGMPSSPTGRLRVGARNVPLGLLANSLAQIGNLDRAVLDRTGLGGNFDFTFEWTPQHNGPGTPEVNGPHPFVDQSVSTFRDDLREQLGLKLESETAPMEVLVVDNAERPVEN